MLYMQGEAPNHESSLLLRIKPMHYTEDSHVLHSAPSTDPYNRHQPTQKRGRKKDTSDNTCAHACKNFVPL